MHLRSCQSNVCLHQRDSRVQTVLCVLVDGCLLEGTAITVARSNFPWPQIAGSCLFGRPDSAKKTSAGDWGPGSSDQLPRHSRDTQHHWCKQHPCRNHEFRKDGGPCSSNKLSAYMLQDDEAQGPYYKHSWATRMAPSKTPLHADKVRKHGSCGKQARMDHFPERCRPNLSRMERKVGLHG